MKDNTEAIKVFFDKTSRQFDSYYSEKKPLIKRVLDYIFRRSMNRRVRLAMDECVQSGNQMKILDVGCGSGRLSIALSMQPTTHSVLGIDFSQEMIELAHRRAKEHRIDEKCRFVEDDFAAYVFENKYDIAVALGFFDYTSDPGAYLKKMKNITTKKIIASFPAKWRLRNLVRIVRLKILKCPVYFYTPRKIQNILNAASMRDYQIKNIGRDYFVIAYP